MVRRALFVLLFLAPLLPAGTAADLGAELRQVALDPEACYRVRDLTIQRDDARIYLTDGFVMFGKPVAGRRIVAVYHAAESGDDAEVLLRPPDRSERASLAKATGSPNMNEHFRSAVMVFTDDTANDLMKQIESGVIKKNPDMGVLVADRVNETARNLATSFQTRLVHDLLTNDPARGFFYTAFMGQRLGNFDLLFDPTSSEQIIAGQVSVKAAVTAFDIWTSFQTRARRQGRKAPGQDVRVESYKIDATIQPDLLIEATTRAGVKAVRRVAGAIAFELAPQMEVLSATLDGKPVEVFRRESFRANLIGGRQNEPILVILPEPLAAGSSHEIEFRHSGKVILPAGNRVYFVAARTNWYPLRGFGFASYDIQFRAPKDLNVVATGDLVEERVEGEWRIAHRKTSAPVRLAGFNVGAYESVTFSRGDLQIEVCTNRQAEPALSDRAQVVIMPSPMPPRPGIRRPGDVVALPVPAPDPRARMTDLASEIASSFEWMAGQFGPPPLKRLTVSPIPGNFGQGFPGLLYLSTLTFLREQERPTPLRTPQQTTFYSEILHAHESAHQWWGNLVTSASYHDDWIQEGLANYSALMVLERRKGVKALETSLEEYKDELRRPAPTGGTLDAFGPITWGVRLQLEQTPNPWRVITYNKGTWIMHMLRRRMGDAQFLAMLKEMVKRYAYAEITTEQFRELAATFVPKDSPDPTLEGFFDTWVYSTGIPTLEYSTDIKGKVPAIVASVTVKQSGVPDDFSIDLPVEIRMPGVAKPLVRWIRTSSEPATLTVRLKAAPAKVEVAPGAGVLGFKK